MRLALPFWKNLDAELSFVRLQIFNRHQKTIRDIKMDFLATIHKLRDFFKVNQYSNGLQVKIHLAFTILGMTEQELQKSMKNTL